MKSIEKSFVSERLISPDQLRKIDTVLAEILEDEFGSFIFYSGEHGNFAPAKTRDINYILNYLKLKPGQKFTDLGSGDGRWLYIAAILKLQAEGFEADPRIFDIAQKIKDRLITDNILKGDDVSRINMENKDFFLSDLSKSSAIIYYQGSGAGTELVEKKILAEAKPGTKVVLYGSIPNSGVFKNLTLLDAPDFRSHVNTQLYQVPTI
jgi:precorrin-6B methylase 2